MQSLIDDRDRQIREHQQRLEEARQENERLKAETNRLHLEAKQKIEKLMDRIRELNLRNTGGDKKQGFLR